MVAVTGYNAFFPNKPPAFHRTAANHARLAALFQVSFALFQVSLAPLLGLFASVLGFFRRACMQRRNAEGVRACFHAPIPVVVLYARATHTHTHTHTHTRQVAVVVTLGWKALVMLYIAETAWSLPVHPGSVCE